MRGIFRKTMARFLLDRGLIEKLQFKSCGDMHALGIETRKHIEESRDLIPSSGRNLETRQQRSDGEA